MNTTRLENLDLNLSKKVKKETEIDLIDKLKTGKIAIDDFEVQDDEVCFWFYSQELINGLDDTELRIKLDEVIEKLEDYYSNVVTCQNNFYSVTNKTSWVDHAGNLEEDGDLEQISRNLVLDALYELALDGQETNINYNLNVSVPVSVDLKQYGLTLNDWNTKTEKEKAELVIEIFNDEIGLKHYNVTQI